MALAPYASDPRKTRGRLADEPFSPTRSDFQRDRDRIIHSAAFRRLKHKTQVFLYHEGDHYRTRLTHSLEVAQVARSLARGMNVCEDLAEAIALSHDLGHPPFGHTGEDALDGMMAGFGGFDHNAQSLRVVTHLERRYAAFDGLNLTWETLEGLVKHNGPMIGPFSSGIPVPVAITEFDGDWNLDLGRFSGVEAQIAAIADDIAYDSHDIDDALRAGFLQIDDLRNIPVARDALQDVESRHPDLDPSRTIHEVLRRVLTWLIEDVFQETARRVDQLNIQNDKDVRAASQPIVAFSDGMKSDERALKDFMFANVYRHPDIMAIRSEANHILEEVFDAYLNDPILLPTPEWQEAAKQGDQRLRRFICDFIAGMTDRYALQEYERIVGETPLMMR